jgi:hypothetical protein
MTLSDAVINVFREIFVKYIINEKSRTTGERFLYFT